MIKLNINEYRDKVLGCWMGKNIGGTLGAPFEWRRQINDVNFYTQELGGDPLPNDDLDIQLLWLVALEEQGLTLDANLLAEYWCIYVTPHWAEYGNGKQNMRMGLLPPVSGSFNNPYKDSCGAFIRSEIWACIAPGCPQLAARYAYQDAVLDHGNGEGTYAEVFCAVMESAAFVENDLSKLIDIGLSYIPKDCAVARSAQTALKAHRDGKTWQEARDMVLADYRGSSMGEIPELTAPYDREKGFDKGKRGWDVPSNIGLLVLGLAYGEGDFEKTICTAVNCGEDTDCTGATAGSIFGIMRGYQSISPKWIEPIGRKIKTACLNLGELGYFGNQLPQDVDDMTRRTERIARLAIETYHLPVQLSEEKTDLSELDPANLFGLDPAVRSERNASTQPWAPPDYQNLNAYVHRFPFYEVAVDVGEQPLVRDMEPKTVVLRMRNLYKVQDNLRVHWYLPEGWRISPSPDGQIQVPTGFLQHQSTTQVTFQLSTDRVQGDVVRFAIELTVSGRPTVMLVPVTLVNGNYYPA
jgi:ADP-ribosylglycohydrolase